MAGALTCDGFGLLGNVAMALASYCAILEICDHGGVMTR
jgi:hypothetical protein